jgi:hypothetical protein
MIMDDVFKKLRESVLADLRIDDGPAAPRCARLVVTGRGDARHVVADMDVDGCPAAEREANKALVVAAPRMLDALERIAGLNEGEDDRTWANVLKEMTGICEEFPSLSGPGHSRGVWMAGHWNGTVFVHAGPVLVARVAATHLGEGRDEALGRFICMAPVLRKVFQDTLSDIEVVDMDEHLHPFIAEEVRRVVDLVAGPGRCGMDGSERSEDGVRP